MILSVSRNASAESSCARKRKKKRTFDLQSEKLDQHPVARRKQVRKTDQFILQLLPLQLGLDNLSDQIAMLDIDLTQARLQLS